MSLLNVAYKGLARSKKEIESGKKSSQLEEVQSLEELERQGLNGHAGKTDSDPATKAEEKELAEVLRRMVEHLPAAQREALDLWIEGFSYREIAEIVSKQEGHIRVLVHRGLTNLREHPRVRKWVDDESNTPKYLSKYYVEV